MIRLAPIRPERPDPALPASPEAIARAFAIRLVREFGQDASRLIDCAVAQVQAELRRGKQ
jgi:hypothetical protein